MLLRLVRITGRQQLGQQPNKQIEHNNKNDHKYEHGPPVLSHPHLYILDRDISEQEADQSVERRLAIGRSAIRKDVTVAVGAAASGARLHHNARVKLAHDLRDREAVRAHRLSRRVLAVQACHAAQGPLVHRGVTQVAGQRARLQAVLQANRARALTADADLVQNACKTIR